MTRHNLGAGKMSLGCALGTVLVLGTSAVALAQAHDRAVAYPSKPVRWLIPFAPGGGTDMVARPIAHKFTERLGQQVIYDNRGGGGGTIAGEIAARAAPDGYTLLIGAVAVMTVNSSLMKQPFDPLKDFTPITKFAAVPNMLAARSGIALQKVQDIISFAQANPGKLRWALSGPGSAGTLSMELFRLNTKIKVIPIPYKGAGPAMIAVVSNEADLMFANPAVFIPHIQGGRLRALATASMQRIAALPDMPTFHESGFANFESLSWYGPLAPTGTPQSIIHLLHKEFTAILKLPDIIARITQDGGMPIGNTPQEYARELREETAKWARVIREANIKL